MLLVPRHFVRTPKRRLWRHLPLEGIGPLRGISEGIAQHEERFGSVLPDFRGCRDLFIASDYSGARSDKASHYEVFSFLIFPYHEATSWETDRLRIRESLLGDRSMTLKKMNDGVRRRALPPFLEAADTIPGLLVTAAVSKLHASLFDRNQLDMSAPDLARFSHWDRGAFEKLLQIVHILTFFLANLSHEGQPFRWYSDNDDIVANTDRKQELGEIWRAVVTNMVPHHVPEITLGTEADDEPTHSLSDALAIPDLVCGAWCQLLTRARAVNFIHGREEVAATLPTLTTPALRILSWFAISGRPLKRLLCIIDDPIPPNEVGYMCSIPPSLDDFKRRVDEELSTRPAA